MGMDQVSGRNEGGWLVYYAKGVHNKEIIAYPADVKGVANWALFQSMVMPNPEWGYGTFEDFTPSILYSTTAYPGYAVTVATSGTLVMADAAGGVLQLTPAAAENQGIQMQTDGEIFLPAANKDIWFECRVRGNDVTEVDWFIGLCETDTNIIQANPTNVIGFWTHDGDANIDFEVSSSVGAAAADTGTDLADNTWIRLGFFVNGITSVTPYINGTAQTAIGATNIPATELALAFAVLSGEGQANRLDIDWYKIVQRR